MKLWTTKLSVSPLPFLLKPILEVEVKANQLLPMPMQIYTQSHKTQELLGMTLRTQGKLLLHEARSHSGLTLLTVVRKGPHEEQVSALNNTQIINISYDTKTEYTTVIPAIFQHHHPILHPTKSERKLF